MGKLNIFHKIIGEYILTKRSKTHIPKINEDLAYLIGVITGDGSLSMVKRSKGGFHYKVKITSDTKKYLEYLDCLFIKYFRISGMILKDKRKESTYDLTLQNAAIFWYFVVIGLSIGKKIRIRIPDIINTTNLLLNYLSGLSDTDGHVAGNRIQLKQKDQDFLKEICERLNKLKFNCNPPKVNYTDSKPFYYIRFDNKLSLRYATVAQ